MIYLSGPVIAALNACTLMAVNKAMRAGHYGRLIHRGRIGYVALAVVERRAGRNFTPDQLMRAAAGRPDRILTIPESVNEEA